MGDAINGSGNIEYGFERGEGPIFLPARRWQSAPNTDGYSLRFDGTDDFAFISHDARMNLATAMTLEAWVKPERIGAGTIVAKASSSVVCYSIGLTSQNRALFKVFNSSATAFLSMTGTTVLATGQWRHVSASWDGSQGKLMIDGVVDASRSGSGSTRVSTISSFQIGSIFGSEAFQGCLDQVRVWNIARVDFDVQSDYQTILQGNEAGLAGLWRLAGNEGQTAFDSTPNALHLNLGSDPTVDGNDPTWRTESFPPQRSYSEILNFGLPCLVVGHPSTTGDVYELQLTTNISTSVWSRIGHPVAALTSRVEYLVWPTNGFAVFRAMGPAAPVLFLADYFESLAVSTNWFITYEFDGNEANTLVANSTNRAHSGTRSLALGSIGSGRIDVHTTWTLPKPITSGRLSWWQYDERIPVYTDMQVRSAQGNYVAGAGFLDSDTSTGYAYAGANSAPFSRAIGWHKYEVQISNGVVGLRMDDTFMVGGTTTTGLQQVYFKLGNFYRGTLTIYFDDLEISDDAL